jgi:hypothetical protein
MTDRFLPVGKLVLALNWCCDLEEGEMVETPEYNDNKLHLGVMSYFQMCMLSDIVNLIMRLAEMNVIVYPVMVDLSARLYTSQHPEVL